MVAAVAGLARSQTGAVFGALAVLLVVPVLGLAPALQPWLPSELLAAIGALVEGGSACDFARSAVVALVTIAALLAFAIHRFDRRET